MNILPLYIKELLLEQTCVVVPDFGGFLLQIHPANFDANQNIFKAPQKRIAFNEVLRFDDGLLAAYISKTEKIGREEALLKIKKSVEDIRINLKKHNAYCFENIGNFSLNAEKRIVFSPVAKLDFFADNFGLHDVVLKKKQAPVGDIQHIKASAQPEINIDQATVFELPQQTPIQSLPSRKKWAYSVAASVLLGACLFLNSDSNTLSSSLNPFSNWLKTINENSIRYTNTAKHADSLVAVLFAIPAPLDNSETLFFKTMQDTARVIDFEKELTLVSNTLKEERIKNIEREISISKIRYFVVAGSFKTLKVAQTLKKQLAKKGYRGVLVSTPKRKKDLFKVVVGIYENPDIAYKKAEMLSHLTREDAWVFKQKR